VSPPENRVSFAELLPRCEFTSDERVIPLGVSGGPDSVAMALLAVEAGMAVEIWHVHHGLRPTADRDAGLTADLAAMLGAPFVERRLDLAPGPDLEARAREARYDVLPADVCVGHTADDRAETVLMNLLRGAGPAGVAPSFERVRRPILGLRRAETRGLCTALGVPTADDPMNHDPAFTRVAVRERLVPLIAEIFDRDPVPLLNRHADLVADTLEVVRDDAATLDPTDAAALRSAPRAVASEAIRQWLRSTTGSPHSVDAASIDRVLAVAANEILATEVSGGSRVARTDGVLRVEPGSAPPRTALGSRR
jgi:tRNA(Ile)-lysidine synthase